MPDVSRWKLTFPIVVLVGLLGLTLGAGVTAGTKGAELTANTTKNGEQDTRLEAQQKEITAVDKRTAILETHVGNLVKAMDRIEEHFGTKPQ